MSRPHGKPLLGQLSGKWYSSSVDQSDIPEIGVNEAFDDRDEEEDVEIKISASGSVLTPSSDPYDKLTKLKQANAQLLAADLPPRPPGKVRFNDAVSTAAEDEEEGAEDVLGVEALKTSPGKILLVTVPTGFSQDLDDVNSDEEIMDETENKDEPTKNNEDCEYDAPKIKKAITFNDYSVDMKSVDDDYENTVEDLTTTLVSLCRMTSECDDTSLENNISKYAKVTIESNYEDVVEEDEDGNDGDDSAEETLIVDDVDVKTDGLIEDETLKENEPAEPINIVKRIASARLVSHEKDKSEKISSGNDPVRPNSSPGKRVCFKNQWAYAKLPSYNGLRSEYGLSAEQLEERKKKRAESARLHKQQKDELFREEKRRQKENEQMFANWLVKKKKEAAMKAARRKQLQSAFYFKTLPAPTSHLEKLGVLRKKVLARREHTCYSLEEFFKNAKPHEQKTYKIYLGLSVE